MDDRRRLLLAASACAWLLLAASVAASATITGTVFEDRNYGGGAGRSLAASGGSVIQNVRVEIYTAAGAFQTSTNTSAAGVYTVNRLGAGTYTLRVANRSIASTRGGGCAAGTRPPLQSFRTNPAPLPLSAGHDPVRCQD